MYPYNSGEGKDFKLLIQLYEQMQADGSTNFFDKSDLVKLLDYYESNGAMDKSLELTDFGLTQYPYSATFYLRKAQLFIDLEKDNEALELLEQAKIYDASELDIYILKAEILSRKKQYIEALELLDMVAARSDKQDLDEVYLAYANIFEDQDQFANMFNALVKVLKYNPKNQTALERIWLSVELSGLYDESIKLHKWVIDQAPYSQWAWYNLGHAYSCKKLFLKAAEAFEYAYIIKDDFALAYKECGEALMEIEHFEAAKNCYLEALEQLPFDIEMCESLAYSLEQLGRYEESRNYYRELLKIIPGKASYCNSIGYCYYKEKNWKEAIKAYKKAVEDEPNNATYLIALASAYAENEDYTEANDLYLEALELEVENEEAWGQYILFLTDLEEYDAALKAIELALDFVEETSIRCCEIGVNYLVGHKKEAIHRLMMLLDNDYNALSNLFEMFPELEKDKDVLQLVARYS